MISLIFFWKLSTTQMCTEGNHVAGKIIRIRTDNERQCVKNELLIIQETASSYYDAVSCIQSIFVI